MTFREATLRLHSALTYIGRYTGEGSEATPWQEIVKDCSKTAHDTLTVVNRSTFEDPHKERLDLIAEVWTTFEQGETARYPAGVYEELAHLLKCIACGENYAIEPDGWGNRESFAFGELLAGLFKRGHGVYAYIVKQKS